jgi:hypothetical protein
MEQLELPLFFKPLKNSLTMAKRTNKIFCEITHNTPLSGAVESLTWEDLEEAVRSLDFTWWQDEHNASTFRVTDATFKQVGQKHRMAIPKGKEACHWCGFLVEEGTLQLVGKINLELCSRCLPC